MTVKDCESSRVHHSYNYNEVKSDVSVITEAYKRACRLHWSCNHAHPCQRDAVCMCNLCGAAMSSLGQGSVID